MRLRDSFGHASCVRIAAASGVALTTLLAPAASFAQAADGRKTGVLFYTENDDWWPDTGTDKDYTNGFRLTIDRNSDSFRLHRWKIFEKWVPAYGSCHVAQPAQKKCISSAFHFGQQFYTPDDISIRELIPNDWPYAGWLYVGGSWRAASINQAVISDAYVGFTGKPSLGREVQTQWHKIVSATKPEGWDNQIGTRLGINVAHSRHWAVKDLMRDGRRWLEVTPFVGGNAGNIMVDGYAGGRVKLGYNITRDWTHSAIGPAAISPRALEREGTKQSNFEAFISVDGRGRVVPYNVFLDAAEHHTIHRRHAIGEMAVGVGIRVSRFMFTYRVAKISKEYDEALTHHEFKALRFAVLVR
jgi:hypothetical protein